MISVICECAKEIRPIEGSLLGVFMAICFVGTITYFGLCWWKENKQRK